MKRPLRSEAELRTAISSPSFTPGARDVEPLLTLLAGAEEDVAVAALHALVRAPALDVARERFGDARPPLRGRLCELVARIADREPTADLRTWLEERLGDRDSVVRRRAARALGRQGRPESETALLSALTVAASDSERKAIAQALGNLGSEDSRAALATLVSASGELGRVAGEAHTKLERTRTRAVETVLDDRKSPRRGTELLLHVRAGLESLLISELEGSSLGAAKSGRGRIAITLEGPLKAIWRARTFLHCGFPLAAERIGRSPVSRPWRYFRRGRAVRFVGASSGPTPGIVGRRLCAWPEPCRSSAPSSSTIRGRPLGRPSCTREPIA
jgi:hypothetical protein